MLLCFLNNDGLKGGQFSRMSLVFVLPEKSVSLMCPSSQTRVEKHSHSFA